MKILLKYSLWAIAIAAFSTGVTAQAKQSREFNEAWNGIHRVKVNHRHGTLEVIPHSGNEVKLEAHILVHAKEEADAQILIDHFEIKPTVTGNNLTIETKFNTKLWNTTNNNTRIKFSDGTKVTGIKKIEITYKLLVPELEKLELSNKYSDIVVAGNFTGDLTVNQYDGTFSAKNISGILDLILKYGKAYIGSVGELKMNIYDSKVEISEANNVNIKSKYSGLRLGIIQSANIDSYDGFCKIESVSGDLHIVDKYSTYEIGSAGNAFVNMYDGKMRLDKVTNYSGTSKYSTYDFKEIGSIHLKTVHDDHFNIQTLGTFSCEESKYTSYDINHLSDKLTITSSYDDELIVNTVDASFRHFEIDCKYSTIKLPLSALPGYDINAKMKYGKLSYAEPSENIMHKEHNEQLELRARVGKPNPDVKVIINGYDSNIRLK